MKIKRLLNTFTAATIMAGSFSAMLPKAVFSQNATPVSVELFLSVDVSGSVNATEYELQKQGYIAAFQDPEIIDLIEALPNGLAVAIETWNSNIKKTSSWYLVEDANDAANFVEAIKDTLNAKSGGGGTDITKAINSATNKILNNQYVGDALVIDISGDGISKNTSVGNPNSSTYNNYKTQVREYLDNNGLSDIPNIVDKDSYTHDKYRGEFKQDNYKCSIGQDVDSNLNPIWKVPIKNLYCPPLEEAVSNAENNNITINGLPINGNPDSNSGKRWREGEVSDYYQNHIITSDGFVETASGFDDFTRAVKSKIETEITNAFDEFTVPIVSCPVLGDTLELTGTIRDFSDTHPDFQYRIGNDRDMVTTNIGSDRKPVYANPNGTTYTTNGKQYFDQWYRNVEGVNESMPYSITLEKQDNGNYRYENTNFFPINNQMMGNEGRSKNFHFTYEIHSQFTYEGGEVLNFSGDDDVWVYINGKRVIDLGGVHGKQDASVNIDDVAADLGLEIGQTYNFDFFFAERHTTKSNFILETSINLLCDSDGDGISDPEESAPFGDPDGDGGVPIIDPNTGLTTQDIDKDGIPNWLDPDSDGDGFPDGYGGNPTPPGGNPNPYPNPNPDPTPNPTPDPRPYQFDYAD